METIPKQPDAKAPDPLPPGNSAVEIAARKGFGPLSAMLADAWHGDSRPCPSCGQLVRRSAGACGSCGENLSSEMIGRMRDFAGPWYVLDHVRPFPGVTYERFLRQSRRGVLTETTVIRGPATDHQWRFAGETPGLSKYLGICWKCHGRVIPQETTCAACGVGLGELTDETSNGQAGPLGAAPILGASGPEPPALKDLRKVVGSMPHSARLESDAPRVGAIKASWIVATILVVVVAVLAAVVGVGDRDIRRASEAPTTSLSQPPG